MTKSSVEFQVGKKIESSYSNAITKKRKPIEYHHQKYMPKEDYQFAIAYHIHHHHHSHQ